MFWSVIRFLNCTTGPINNAIIYEGAGGNPELDSGGSTFSNGFVTGNNVAMLFDWADTSDGLGWQDSGGNGTWNVGGVNYLKKIQEFLQKNV